MGVWQYLSKALSIFGRWGFKFTELFLSKKVMFGSFTIFALFFLLAGSVHEAVTEGNAMIVLEDFGKITIGVDYELEQSTNIILNQEYEEVFNMMWLGILFTFLDVITLAWMYFLLIMFIFKIYSPTDTSKQVRNTILALLTIPYIQILYYFMFVSRESGVVRTIGGYSLSTPLAYFLIGVIILGLILVLFTDQLIMALIPFLGIITWIFIFPEQRVPFTGLVFFIWNILPLLGRIGDFLAPDKFSALETGMNITNNTLNGTLS